MFSAQEIESNRRWFEAKLLAERQLNDVIKKAKGQSDAAFLLVDARGRDAYAKAHLPGALCIPLDEVEALAPRLAKDKEYVTYCWSHT
jgi:rhodanese-related sulfurtransferase